MSFSDSAKKQSSDELDMTKDDQKKMNDTTMMVSPIAAGKVGDNNDQSDEKIEDKTLQDLSQVL